jgi:hypothetical protein
LIIEVDKKGWYGSTVQAHFMSQIPIPYTHFGSANVDAKTISQSQEIVVQKCKKSQLAKLSAKILRDTFLSSVSQKAKVSRETHENSTKDN